MIRYEYRTQTLIGTPDDKWEDLLNHLGQQRWELVQVLTLPPKVKGDYIKQVAIFKRPEIP